MPTRRVTDIWGVLVFLIENPKYLYLFTEKKDVDFHSESANKLKMTLFW